MKSANKKWDFRIELIFELNDEWWKSGDNRTDFTSQEPDVPKEWFAIYSAGDDNQIIPKSDLLKFEN